MVNFSNVSKQQEFGNVSLDRLAKKKEFEKFRQERPHLFILPASGESVIRIISENPFQYFVHFYTDRVRNRMIKATCLGEKCQVCNDTSLNSRERKPTKRFAFWIIDPNKELKVFEVGIMLCGLISNAFKQMMSTIEPIKYDLQLRRVGSGIETKYLVYISKFQRNLTDVIETSFKTIERYPIASVITNIEEIREHAIETQRILDKSW